MNGAVEHDEASKLAYVVDLATKLADRIVDARFSGRAIEPEQIEALIRAARLIQDLGVPWPPMMAQVLHEFADSLSSGDAPKPLGAETNGDRAVAGLSRFLGAFRRDKSSRAEA